MSDWSQLLDGPGDLVHVRHVRVLTEEIDALRVRADRLAVENAELREAGNALAKAGLRVVRGEGTTQRYEYLLTAIERWEALVGTEEG